MQGVPESEAWNVSVLTFTGLESGGQATASGPSFKSTFLDFIAKSDFEFQMYHVNFSATGKPLHETIPCIAYRKDLPPSSLASDPKWDDGTRTFPQTKEENAGPKHQTTRKEMPRSKHASPHRLDEFSFASFSFDHL